MLTPVLYGRTEKIREHIQSIGRSVLDGMTAVNGVVLHGPSRMADNIGVFSFTVEGRDPAEIAEKLSGMGIMVRVGMQCSPSAHRVIGTFPQGTVRASIGYFTTQDEIDHFLRSLRSICNV